MRPIIHDFLALQHARPTTMFPALQLWSWMPIDPRVPAEAAAHRSERAVPENEGLTREQQNPLAGRSISRVQVSGLSLRTKRVPETRMSYGRRRSHRQHK